MKKKLFIALCIVLALAGGCAKDDTEKPNNGEVSGNENNENQDGEQQSTPTPTPTPQKQEITPVLPDPTTDPDPTPTEELTPTPEGPIVYTYTEKDVTMYANGSLNVRDLPSIDGEVIGDLELGESVHITGVCNETEWYRISYEGGEAYVSHKYIVENQPVTPTPAPTEAPTATPTATPEPTQAPTEDPEEGETSEYTYTEKDMTMYAKSNVFVRDLPNKDGEVLGGLVASQSVKVTGVCNETGWYRILHNGMTGYVSKGYLVDTKPSTETPTATPTVKPTTAPTATPKPSVAPTTTPQDPASSDFTYTAKDMTMYVKSEVNVRDLPSVDGTVIDSLTKNQKVKVTGICNETGWYRIIYGGNEGYVSLGYLVDTPVAE